ncbi:hydantoinase B/oxoprolinase family protein [Sphingosinicella sp.]|uniref:hydantoinase B/oxoprolinase family protein n=1 Tax=Sphingosinicella sp. TaxID=1917971 RepID=UPI0017929BC7|nr:hydantoinase B/oxoprolinase family protein [Sphingosinicella sp.]MBA4758883.1 hydantoinase B/oxoprolinase family protein [Sphingosinicella sp.]
MARIIETNTTPWPTADVDPVTLDVIENALQNARVQMDAILFRTAISPIIREQRDGFPVLTNREGMMLAGQFGSPVDGFVDNYDGEVSEGDVLLTNDPYACQGAISHLNDWLFCMPVFYEGRLLGWTAMFGHMSDISGMTAASMPVTSSDLLQEGIVIPPVKIVSKGELQKDLLRMAMRNTRTPDWNEADFFAILSACRTGAARLIEMADRFGPDVLCSAQDQLLKRNREAMRALIVSTMPEKKVVFEDWICDDATGHGPYKLGCEMWREGDKLIFDFSRTDPQSAGCINFLLNERMFKMFCGQFMVNVYDPQIVLNDGYIDLIDVRIPKGTLLNPIAPAALNGRTHALGRIFDIISGLFGSANPDFLVAAGFSDSPHFMYSGFNKSNDWFLLFQIGFGGIPGKPGGDGPDGHSLWPKFRNVPNEYIEAYFPIRIDRFESLIDTGGAGKHRGGNGVRTEYVFDVEGEISIHDDRWLTYPWGVKGGQPGKRSRKLLVRADGEEKILPSKIDHIFVQPGDRLIFDTWGGGGWGDPLERDTAAVAYDVEAGLVSPEGARRYGVVISDDGVVDDAATEALRAEMRKTRPQVNAFEFGPSIAELRASCFEETGLQPPVDPVASPIATAWFSKRGEPVPMPQRLIAAE